jgi:hypothetical protein
MMRCPIPLLILLLAPILATGCREAPDAETVIRPGPREVYVKVKAHLEEEDGKPVAVFDDDYHDTEVVRPGDKLSFACECEDGLEVTISEPKLILDLEALEALMEGQDGKTLEDKVENLRVRLEQARDYLKNQAVPAGNGEYAYLKKQAVPAETGDNGEFLQALLGDFLAVIPDVAEARLFDDTWRQLDFYPGDQSIGPFTVGPIDQESIWKFTWRVRVQGQPPTEERWDPHLIGHPDMKL